MRLITLEEHFTTEKFQSEAGPKADHIRSQKELNEKLLDLGEGRIAAMDEAGIDLQVLSFSGFGVYKLPIGKAVKIVKDANDRVKAAADAHPTRFRGFAALPMQSPDDAVSEFERCIEELGFVGAMIDGTIDGKFLDQPKFFKVFETAVRLDVPVYLHPAPPPAPVMEAYFGDLAPPLDFMLSTAAWGWHAETGLHSLRLIISGLFDKLPTLKLIIGHMGENLPFSIVRADTVLSKGGLKLDRSPLQVFKENCWITNSGYFSTPPMLCAREVIGIDRILLSIDYPYSEMSEGRKMLDNLKNVLPQEELEAFASRNVEKLLKL